jgi:enoyl-CoA hydratase/carnithine racemase
VSGAVREERREDGVALLRLDNAAHRNALNDSMIAGLTVALRALADKVVRAAATKPEPAQPCRRAERR